MEKEKIAIIIQAYNEEEYIAECIQSVLNQTYFSFKLIVINNGSTDQTEKEILKFVDPRIQYVNQFENNVFISFELLLSCDTKYVAQLNANDLIMPTMLEEVINILEKKPELDVVNCDHMNIDKAGKITSKIRNTIYWNKIDKDIDYMIHDYMLQFRYFFAGTYILNWERNKEKIINRSWLNEKLFKVGWGAGDLYFWEYLCLCKIKMYHLNKKLFLERVPEKKGKRDTVRLDASGERFLSRLRAVNQIMHDTQEISLNTNTYQKFYVKNRVVYAGCLENNMARIFQNIEAMKILSQEVIKADWLKEFLKQHTKMLVYFKLLDPLYAIFLEKKLEHKFIRNAYFNYIWQEILLINKHYIKEYYNNQKIGIYGTGLNGRLLALYFKNNGISINKFLEKEFQCEVVDKREVNYPRINNVSELDMIIISYEKDWQCLEVNQQLIETGYKGKIIYWMNLGKGDADE